MLPAVEATSLLLLALLSGCYAPVPRCSPFIIINKIPESTSLGADFNPYFPVPGDPFILLFYGHSIVGFSECEYGGPLQAMLAGDFKAVSLLADGPWKIPRFI